MRHLAVTVLRALRFLNHSSALRRAGHGSVTIHVRRVAYAALISGGLAFGIAATAYGAFSDEDRQTARAAPVATDTFSRDLRLMVFAEAARVAEIANTLRTIAYADALRAHEHAEALRAIAYARATAPVGPPPAAATTETRPAPQAARAPTTDASFTAAIFAAINARRAEAGLAPVANDGRLASSAASYARTMLRLNGFGHSVDGTAFDARNRAAGFTENVVMGEIIAMSTGATTPAKIVQMWMDSPPHRSQILSATFRLAGAGCAFAGSDARCVVEFAG